MRASDMKVTIKDLGVSAQEQLRERLDRAASLRCNDHGQSVVALTINGRENGWFDTRWTTCCESLEQQASAIVKQRC
jgi:hypothetical protein